MTRPDLVLNGDEFWISPYVFTVYVTLTEKELPFEVRDVALHRKEQERPEYAARAITARVPSLEHRGLVVAESSAIIEYLEEVFGPPAHAAVLPQTPEDRARARQVMSWLRSDDTLPIREQRPTTSMFYARASKPLDGPAARAAEKLLGIAAKLLKPGASTLFGAWCIADTELAFMLQRLVLNGDPVPAPIRAFAEAQWSRPSVRAYVERERAPYVAY